MFTPESIRCRRRTGVGRASAGAAGAGSMGNVVIRSESYPSSVTGL